MIPASYLFRQVYHQHWEEEAEVTAEPQRRDHDGLMSLIARAIAALVSRPETRARPMGGHAYE